LASSVDGTSSAHRLQKGQGYFWTGARHDGKQALVTYTVTDIIVLHFENDGTYAGKELVPLSEPASERLPDGIYRTSAEFHRSAESDILRLTAVMRLDQEDIFVQQFYDDDTHCGLEVISKDSIGEDVPDWRGEGRFLLWLCGIDHWICRDGRVHSHG
jgi:hypothetical protein